MVSHVAINREIGVDNQMGILNGESRFHYLKHSPQAAFILRDDMELIEANERGVHAIEMHWIGLASNKVHFNCAKTDQYVKGVLSQITHSEPASRSFILPCVDSVYRSYTLMHDPFEYDSKDHKEYFLTIQSDLICDNDKINTLAQAFSLSDSESKILKLMVSGLKPKEIAFEKGISLCTVRSHLRTLYAKMNVRNYNDALILAVRLLS